MMATKVKSLYGFSPDLPPFVGKSPAAQADLLKSWGNTAVFGGYQNPEFVAAVHAAGLKLYAEFACFVGATWWEKVPASRPVTSTGELLPQQKWYCGVNPTTPAVRREQLAALERLLTTYPLDGVWLDFIRWPCHWEGRDPHRPDTSFDAETVHRFSCDTGLKILQGDTASIAQALLNQHEAAWTQWRCEQITTWVAEAKAVIKRVRPGTILGLFNVPWRSDDYDGAILKVVGQDYQALGQYVDVFSPMVYHLMCGRSLSWIGTVIEAVHTLSGKPVWPIIQSVDKPSPLSAKAYGQAIDVALNHAASDGILVFTLAGALAEEKLAVTKAKFRNAA